MAIDFRLELQDNWSSLEMIFRSHATATNFLKHLQIREGRKQTLAECLEKEFRLTMNILRTTISADVYEVLTCVVFYM
jgi:F0F1-type ATP synthase delta subunit